MASALEAALCAQKWDRIAKGPAWAAGTDMTQLLQLHFPSPLPGRVLTELWGATVTYLGITQRVHVPELLEVCGVTSCSSPKIQRCFYVALGSGRLTALLLAGVSLMN